MKRPVLPLSIAFLCTVFLILKLPTVPAIILCAGAIVISLATAILLSRFRLPAILILAGICIGLCAGIADLYLHRTVPSQFDKKRGTLYARVLSVTPEHNNRAVYRVTMLSHSFSGLPAGHDVLLYGNIYSVEPGDRIFLSVNAHAPDDSRTYLTDSDERMVTFSSYTPPIRVERGNFLARLPFLLKQSAATVLNRSLQEPYAGLARAMLLGDNDGMDPVLKNTFIQAGLSHIFVVSGLHVSVLLMLLYGILVFLPIRFRCFLVLCCTWLLVAMTGFGYPALRAGIMMSILLLGRACGRRSDALTSLFVAGFLIVVWKPSAVISVSFLLSFAATLGIITLQRPLSAMLHRLVRFRFLFPVADAVAVTTASNLTILPISILVFQGISLVTPIANFAVLWLMAPLMVLLCGTVLFSFWPPLSQFLAGLAQALLRFIVDTASGVSAPSFAFLGLSGFTVSLWLAVALVCVGITLLFYRGALLRISGICVVGLCCCLLVTGVMTRNTVQIDTLQDESGERIVIARQQEAVVLAYGDSLWMDNRLITYLRANNIHRIRAYLCSEPMPESRGNLKTLASILPLEQICFDPSDDILPYVAEFLPEIPKIETLADCAGPIWAEDDFAVTLLSADPLQVQVRVGPRVVVLGVPQDGYRQLSAGKLSLWPDGKYRQESP